jgi:PAS domain-containing protein
MERTAHKGLALILARELASNVTIPIFLVDAANTLVFYNEAANEAFGGPFGETGELGHGEWAPRFDPTRPDGTPYERSELPMVIALEERRPAHGLQQVTAVDGSRVVIALTALPLFSGPDDFVGVMAAFWPADESSES